MSRVDTPVRQINDFLHRAFTTLPGAWSAQPGESGAVATPVPSPVDPSTLPGAENAGKPGYHTVRPGDTVRKLAAEYNQDWRDIIRWNQQLPNPDVIEIGQVLRVLPPGRSVAAVNLYLSVYY